MTRLLLVIFIAIFGILNSFGASITITSPNGGEVLAGCVTKNITWTSSGTSNFYSIDYSTDGGTNWTSVTSFLSTTSGSYTWTVPNINSSNCFVRIKDSNTPATVDQSNSKFTITAPLILTSPNGGEKWEAGKVKTITWAATGTSKRYKIEYSTNAGSSWTQIVNNYYNTSGIYNWTVPNAPSTTALVRITDYYTGCMTDKSNNVFTIDPPVPTLSLTYPNGYQTLYSGKAYNIRWSSTNLSSNLIALDYSTNNGSTWTPIVTGISNSGSHSWTVPNTPSTTCLVKVKAVGKTFVDSSSNAFTIKNPHITVTAPNGGENWEGCLTKTIRWTHGGTVGNRFKISYSTNNGGNWTTITSNIYNSSTTNASYNWAIPNTVQGTALIKIEDYNNSLTKDQSDSTFNLSKNSSIIITTPNGGEQWEAGKTKTISWVDNSISRFRVYYSSNGGSSYSYITSNTSANAINWSVPNNPGSNYKIKVQDYYNSCKFDESDSVFKVNPPTPVINVTYPNSNYTFYPSQSINIRWTSAYLTSSFVKIEYSSDSGSTWNVISSVTSNDGSESWTTPSTISNNYLIRVSEYGNSSLNDVSNTTFKVVPPYITLTSPNGGEVWKGCESKRIQWTVGGGSNSYRLEYSLDSGSTWTLITTRSGTYYDWTLPAKLYSTKAKIRVRDLSRNISDESNSTFTFSPNTDIILTAPNGGEKWEAGKTKTISWVDNNLSRFRVYYSSNGGSSYSYVNSYTSANAINWSIPNNPGSNYRVKVQDYYNSCKYDESDSLFTVIPPTPVITVTAPNSGSLYPLYSYSIRWTSAYLTSSFVNIDFSSDSGSTWSSIASSTSNDGSHTWSVPNTISTNCFIRISEVGSANVLDWSGKFTIKAAFLTLISPNGGEVWKGCESKRIQWSVGGGSNSYRIEYSLDSGSTWSLITTRSGSYYDWTLPAKLSSSKAKIRVRDLSRNLSDESNSVLNIVPNTDIILTTPNGGEKWEVGKSKTVSWVDNNLSRFRVYYSSNGGSSYSYINSYTSANALNWTIPNNPGSNYRVKVQDYYNSCKYDESDSLFTVIPPTPVITVTAPSGGTYYPSQSVSIRWTSAFLNSSFVKIEYTSDSGSTWNVISSVTNNDGSESWVTPSTLSDNYFVRVSEYGTSTVNDIGNKFKVVAPFITLTTPNGGEVWKGCESKRIQWSVGGGSNSYRIEYSLDSGSTWTFITTRSGSYYDWTVPAKLSSSKAKIRIRDLSRNISDESNNVFTIVPNTDIIITSPSTAGEKWEAGKTKTVSWVDNNLSRFRVYYSSNGGSSYSYINSYTSANAVNWSVPNNPGTNYRIKVQDYYNSCKFDESKLFQVTPPVPVITVTSPNSGSLYPLQTYSIRWTSAYLNSSFVKIEFSSDSGSTWANITSSTSNDGSHSWVVPNSVSSQCFIRISEVGRPTVNDWSGKFNIAQPYLTLTSPNGGEVWKGCESKRIQWSVGGGSGSYRIEYSLDTGNTWTLITTRSSTYYDWSIPTKLSSNSAMIRVRDLSRNLSDKSNATLRFVPYNSIIVTSPNGGETWEASKTKTITWVDNAVSRFRVYYSSNGGASYSYVSSYVTANAVNWSVPNNPGSNYKIKVADYYNSCKYDESDSVFTVSPPVPYVTMTYPNSNYTFYQGQAINVRWTSGNLTSSFVRLDYSLDSGLTWSTITNVTNNDGSHSWTLPNVNTTKAMVRVSEYGNASMNDISNTTFKIQPSIILTAPNGNNGQVDYRGCTVTSIKWNAGGTSRYYLIQYSLNGGVSWVNINSSYYNSSSAPTYNWTMPNTASKKVLVRVQDKNNTAKSDQSDNQFEITAPITLNTPNQGGTYYVGDTMQIDWTSNGTSNYYNIDYSVNGGTTWTSIVYNHNTSGSNYAWKIPGTVSNNCKIRITDNINSCKKTQSAVAFKIVYGSKKITVNAPKGGESWNGCSSQQIKWTDSGNSTAYKIQYSANGGQAWTTIQSSYATSTKVYNWSVPSSVGNNYLVRVSDASDSTKTDQSDSSFSVSNAVKPVISAVGNTTLCSGNTVSLTVDKTSDITWYPGGIKTQNISVTTAGTYYVLLSDSNGCTIQSNSIVVSSGTPPVAPTITASGATKFCLGGSVILSTNQTSNIKWYPGGQVSQTITASQGGAYTVTYTAANGCSATSLAKVVTTNLIPKVNRTQSSTCIGDTLVLSSNSAIGNLWFPSGDTTQTIKVTTNGNYSVQVTDSNSCVATSQVDTVTFAAKPAAPTVSSSGALAFCSGSTVKLTSNPTNNISWSNGIVDSTITLDSATTVRAIFTNSGGCKSYSNPVTTSILTAPAKPLITAIGDTTFCQGDSVTLASSSLKNKWSNGDTTKNILVKSTGYYSVIGTATNGCTSTSDQLLITVNATPAIPAVSANGSTTICNGDSVILSSNNPSGNLWSTGDSSTSIVVKSAGAYSVKYSNANGCEAISKAIAITVNSAPNIPTIFNSGTDAFCAGDSIILTSSFSGKNVWSTGDSTQSIVVNSSGNYSVEAKGSNGCKSSLAQKSITVKVVPNTPVISLSDTGKLCTGDSITLTSSFANGNIWSTGDSGSSITVSSTGSYTVRTKNTNGCESPIASKTIVFGTRPTKPTISVIGNSTFCQGDSAVLVSSSALNNNWSNGSKTQSITVKSAGGYSVEVGNSSGCVNNSNATLITVNGLPLKPIVSLVGTATFCQGDSVLLVSNKANGNFWNNSDTTRTLKVKSSGLFNVTYTDAKGCKATSNSITITANPLPQKPTIHVAGGVSFCAGDSIVLTSSVLYGNKWSNGDSNKVLVVKSSGNYLVTQSNSFGCKQSSNAIAITKLNKPAKPQLLFTGDTVFCLGDSVVIRSNYSNKLRWANGDSSASIVVKNTALISLMYTNANGCTNSSRVQSIKVNPVPNIPTISNTTPLVFCDGGSVSLTSSAAANNTWSTGDTSNTISVNKTGNYSVKVSNQFGCESSSVKALVTVNTLPTNPLITIVGDTSFCSGDSVLISTNYSNGIRWSNGDTNARLVVKNTGFYKVTYTDTNGCKAVSKTVKTASNPNPSLPTILASGPLEFCDGSSVTLTSSSATKNTWSSGDSTSSVLVKTSGNYSVKVTNAFGCETSSSNTFVKVNQLPNTPSITSSSATSFCQGDSVVLSSSSLLNNKWSTSDTSRSIVVKSTGNYTVKVLDTNGCESKSATQPITVNAVPAAPVISAGGSLGFCQGDSVTLRSNTLSGNIWNTGDTSQVIVVKRNGVYGVKVVNANKCETNSNTLTVSVGNRPVTPSIITSGKTQFCQGDSVVLISSSSSTSVWSTGDSSNSITVKRPGKIGLKVLDNGCLSNEATESITVWLNPQKPVITTSGDTVFCSGDSVILHSSYLVGNVWSHGATTSASLLVKLGGGYYVTYTDTNGCKAKSNVVKTRLLPIPQAPYVSPGGLVDLCEGDTLILKSDAFSGIKWNNNQSPVDTQIVTKAGSYYVDFTDANGCSIASNTVTVNMLPLPVVPTITRIGPDLQSSLANNYQWLLGGVNLIGAIGQNYRPLANGVYQVMISDGKGCRAISIPENFNSVGVEEMDLVHSLKLYPNPSNGNFTMDLVLEKSVELDLLIHNMNGQVVYQENIKPSVVDVTRKFQFGDLPSGIYQFELRSEEFSHSERITINK